MTSYSYSDYPDYVPSWYDPEISYLIMHRYGIGSKELKDYMTFGKVSKDIEQIFNMD